MKDLKLGITGSGSNIATLEHMKKEFHRVKAPGRPDDTKAYDELKTFLSGIQKNVTVRVKHGSGTGELALGKQSGIARLFKGDRSELTAMTLSKMVAERFGVSAGLHFENALRDNEGRFDLHRDKVLAAFRQVESMLRVDNLTGVFQRHDFGTLQDDQAIAAFKRGYPKPDASVELDGMKLSARFYGDIVPRSRVDYEGGALTIRRNIEDYNPQINFITLKRFFMEKLGIAPEDKERMQNAMNNVLCFFEQNTYFGAANEACVRLGFDPGLEDDLVHFRGVISVEGTDLVMKRDIRADLKELIHEKFLKIETGWRYQAEDHFRVPMQSIYVPHAEFKLDALVDARRVEYAERGQREVAVGD
jgi:hypothetical protein